MLRKMISISDTVERSLFLAAKAGDLGFPCLYKWEGGGNQGLTDCPKLFASAAVFLKEICHIAFPNDLSSEGKRPPGGR